MFYIARVVNSVQTVFKAERNFHGSSDGNDSEKFSNSRKND